MLILSVDNFIDIDVRQLPPFFRISSFFIVVMQLNPINLPAETLFTAGSLLITYPLQGWVQCCCMAVLAG